MSRSASIARTTAETAIRIRLEIDGRGEHAVATGIPFLDHMLAQVARHGHFDLAVEATGDLAVDLHHTVEDVGIVLGQAIGLNSGDRFILKQLYPDAQRGRVLAAAGKAFWNRGDRVQLPLAGADAAVPELRGGGATYCPRRTR